jgi:hypothetical protein
MRKIKLSKKAALPLMLSGVLFCMPPSHGFAMAAAINTTSTCTCTDKCTSYAYDYSCKVCLEDYNLCEYKKPNVSITISTADSWVNDIATVSISATDSNYTGNFVIAKIQAKIGQNGSWTDITEEKKLTISENCTVYVQVTDQKGNTYERNRTIKCFDTTKPTLNAAVSEGLLSIQVHDTESGVKKVYVNGYEFTDFTNNTLNIRLQQFDSGYQYFTIYAMDNAGNMSEVYKTANPYYTDPEAESSSQSSSVSQLPVSAEATNPVSATATVTEHTKTDSDGNSIQTSQIGDSEETDSSQSEQGKEFYTVQTASDKVFYLVIDRNGEDETVYFLTEISENDLLNVTSDNSDTLPKNSAALESGIPTSESALPNNNTEQDLENEEMTEEGEGTEATDEAAEEEEKEANPMISYILMGGIALAAVGGGYYFKVVKKKNENFLEEEEDDKEEDLYEEYENEEDDEDDFFADSGDDEEAFFEDTDLEEDEEE